MKQASRTRRAKVIGFGFGALSLTLSASSVAHADPADPDHPTTPAATSSRVAIYAGAGVGSVLDKPGGAAPAGGTVLVLTLPLMRLLTVELIGSTGYALGHVTGTEDDFWARLALGLRIEDSLRTLRPYGAFRLVHLHYASAQTWIDHPGDSIAGSSSEGLQHRSGMALAGGISWTVPHTKQKLRIMGEAELAWVPIGTGPAWFLTTSLGLGLAF
ncbi:MAG: hypothetical protein ACLQVI_34875 [Polyangiaceae bacterium]|jgi:hypothetical protein